MSQAQLEMPRSTGSDAPITNSG